MILVLSHSLFKQVLPLAYEYLKNEFLSLTGCFKMSLLIRTYAKSANKLNLSNRQDAFAKRLEEKNAKNRRVCVSSTYVVVDAIAKHGQ